MNPIVAKILISAVANKKSRNKLFTIILGVVIFMLLITAYLVYVLSNPLSFLGDLLGNDELAVVENLQYDYGMNFANVIFTDGQTEVIYFNQLDEQYANKPYGTDTIGYAGCGPTSMAIVISTLTNEYVNPIEMSKWAYENGYWVSGNGSYHTLIPDSAKAFGLDVQGVTLNDDPQKLVNALASGKLVVAIMGKGEFTSSGHFIVLRGVTEGGKILVADPASYNKSNNEYDLELFYDEARRGSGGGGPFWIIGAVK